MTFSDSDELAWGDVSKYDVIMTGLRAYERRTDMQAYNRRLLVPDHPVFNTPNKIDEDTWMGWVQERGLYFLGEKDRHYVDLLSIEEPFPDNAGVKVGPLVEAKFGEGRWINVGLGLWGQVPAGVEGAYELLANLISPGRTPAAGGAVASARSEQTWGGRPASFLRDSDSGPRDVDRGSTLQERTARDSRPTTLEARLYPRMMNGLVRYGIHLTVDHKKRGRWPRVLAVAD